MDIAIGVQMLDKAIGIWRRANVLEERMKNLFFSTHK